jgi:hypothetical protein
MSKSQPFFAVRVVVHHEGGSSQRDYVRGETRMSKQRFASWALGDMIALVTMRPQRDGTWFSDDEITEWSVTEIDPQTVHENRRYSHTTHNESGEEN